MPFALETNLTEPYVNWKKDPSPVNMDSLLTSMSPIINNGVKAYGNAGNPLHTSHARSILVNALPKYDPRQSSLKTFAMTHLQGLRRMSAKQDQVIHLPETLGIGLSRMDQTTKDLTDDLGRPPSDEELSRKMHIPLKHLAKIRGIKQPIPDGMLMGNVDDEGDYAAPMITGSVKDQQAWQDFVYQSVGPVDQLIMEHSLRLNGKPKKNTSEIAKMVGTSPAAISQRKKKIQALLDSQHKGGLF